MDNRSQTEIDKARRCKTWSVVPGRVFLDPFGNVLIEFYEEKEAAKQ